MDLRGIGPAGAARILADVGDVARFPDRNHFASWTGTAPLDASSGEQIRHRLSRAGNRRLSDMVYRRLVADAKLTERAATDAEEHDVEAGPGGHSGVTHIQRGRRAHLGHRIFGSATPNPRLRR